MDYITLFNQHYDGSGEILVKPIDPISVFLGWEFFEVFDGEEYDY